MSRSGIGIVAVGETESIARAGARVAADQFREVAVRLAIERRRAAVDDDGEGVMRRRPNAKVHAVVDNLRADRATTIHDRPRLQDSRQDGRTSSSAHARRRAALLSRYAAR